jgi:polysaccharide pyruvyl transferase WcaK-like protein
MTVVITDAYSLSNLGDAGLVEETIRTCVTVYGDDCTVFATDPAGFRASAVGGGSVRFVFKPFSRLVWKSKGPAKKSAWLAGEGIALVLALIVVSIPGLRERRVRRVATLARLTRRRWLRHVAEASAVVGVGGGYLGDRYLRESIVTLSIFRIATSLDIETRTMPLSISSADSPALRSMLRVAGRNVAWASRDQNTVNILASVGLASTRVPDLAWAYASRVEGWPERRSGIAVAPVGSDFYDAASQGKLLKAVLDEHARGEPTEAISLIAMHREHRALGDGGDDLRCVQLAGELRTAIPGVTVQVLHVLTYNEVVEVFARVRYLIAERLHAALAGAVSGTQMYVIAYEPKHRGVMEIAGLTELCLPVGSRSSDPTEVQIRTAALEQAHSVERFFAE